MFRVIEEKKGQGVGFAPEYKRVSRLKEDSPARQGGSFTVCRTKDNLALSCGPR